MIDNKDFTELSKNNPKSLIEIGLKLSEESGELAEAILSYEQVNGSTYKNGSIEDVKQESVDVVMVALSAFYKVGGTTKEFTKILEEKTEKWKSKSEYVID